MKKPVRITPLEWEWRRWRMRVGEYKNYRGPRPKHFPKRIPPAWWARFSVYLAKRKLESVTPPAPSYSGPYATPGALIRHPNGGVEDIASYKAQGITWLLANSEYYGDWELVKQRCAMHGVRFGYWFHCRDAAQVRMLLGICRAENVPLCGLNVEAELETSLTPRILRQTIKESGYDGHISLIVYGWVQNDVDLTPVADLPIILEMFPQDAPELYYPRDKWEVCRKHALQLGAHFPMQMSGAYGGAVPAWYDLSVKPTHLYTLDDSAGHPGRWIS